MSKSGGASRGASKPTLGVRERRGGDAGALSQRDRTVERIALLEQRLAQTTGFFARQDIRAELRGQRLLLEYADGNPHGSTTFYHVASESWQPGEPLVGRDFLENTMGYHTPWKWEGDAPEGFDGDGVSLYFHLTGNRTDNARDFQRTYGGRLVEVRVPNQFIAGNRTSRSHARDEWYGSPFDTHSPPGSDDPLFTKNEEGYPFIVGFVPASWITEVK